MFNTILTRRLFTACFAVALGWAFPWKPVEIQPIINYTFYEKMLEIFLNEKKQFPNSTSSLLNILWKNSAQFINYHHGSFCFSEGHILGYILGFVCGWPIADKIGRKNGIVYGTGIRFIGTLLLFLLEFKTVKYINPLIGFTLGLYYGLLSIIGYMFIYEISPKYCTSQINLGALPVLAFYLLTKYFIEFFSSIFTLSSYFSQTIYMTIVLSLTAGILQLALLLKFCSESPSFTIIQRHQYKEAKQILRCLRQTENITDEFKEIKWDRPQHESMKRTSYILMLFIFGHLYNYIVMQIGLFHWIIHGVSLEVAQGIYFVLILISCIFATFNYGRSTLLIPETKKLMFRSYSLFSILFILACILFLSKFHYSNHFIIDCTLVLISIIATIVFYSGPTVITTVLILDYPKQACRGNHLVLCVLFAIILVILITILFFITLGFLFIVLGKLNIYIVTAFIAVFFFFLVWLVWVKEGKLDLKEDNDSDSENIDDENRKAISLSLIKIYDVA